MAYEVAQKTLKNSNCAGNHKDVKKEEYGDGNDGTLRSLKLV